MKNVSAAAIYNSYIFFFFSQNKYWLHIEHNINLKHRSSEVCY